MGQQQPQRIPDNEKRAAREITPEEREYFRERIKSHIQRKYPELPNEIVEKWTADKIKIVEQTRGKFRNYVFSTTDALTQINNRRFYDEKLAYEIKMASRGNIPSLIMIDIDDFKKVNDTYGHSAGDEVLKEVAKVVQESIRNVDVVARYGGEEIAVILPDTDVDGAKVVSERIRKAIEELRITTSNNEELSVTASLGCSAYNAQDGYTAELLQDSSDKALYKAKNSGKNRVVAHI